MTIEYVYRDLTTVEEGVIAHGCNCMGKMGSGVAKAIRDKYPHVYDRYASMVEPHTAAKTNRELLGLALIVNAYTGASERKLFVSNMFTQENYGYDNKRYASPAAIDVALRSTLVFCRSMNLPLYTYKIGCTRGGLDWDIDVRPIVESLAEEFDTINIKVCQYV